MRLYGIRWRTAVAAAILGAAVGASIVSGLGLGTPSSAPPVIHAHLLPAPVIHTPERGTP